MKLNSPATGEVWSFTITDFQAKVIDLKETLWYINFTLFFELTTWVELECFAIGLEPEICMCFSFCSVSIYKKWAHTPAKDYFKQEFMWAFWALTFFPGSILDTIEDC